MRINMRQAYTTKVLQLRTNNCARATMAGRTAEVMTFYNGDLEEEVERHFAKALTVRRSRKKNGLRRQNAWRGVQM